MSEFIANIFERIDANDADSSEAGLELGFLVEVYRRPEPNRERDARYFIGDELVNRGISKKEVEETCRMCLARLQGNSSPSIAIINIAMKLRDARFIPAFFEIIPLGIANPRLDVHANNAIIALYDLIPSQKHPEYSRFMALARRIVKEASPRSFLCEQTVEILRHESSLADDAE